MPKFLRTWGRGTNVPHNKNTAGLSPETMPLPAKILLPMQQHIGAPCKPAVAKGDTVLVGTVVGKAQGFVGADIHSGVSGTVTGIEQTLASNGAFMEVVVIEPDGQQEIDPDIAPPVVRSRESFLDAVRTSGLVGLGGAGFPTHVKLSPKDPGAIDTLIINAAECEPFITVDEQEILECGDTVLSGIMAVKRYLDIEKVFIGIERNKPRALDLMFSLTKGDEELTVFPLPTRYPQGAEKVLIETVTGRQVPASGGLPSDVGVLVLNVTTVSAIGKYLANGMPITTKHLTVDGGALVEPKNVEVIIGTPIADVVEFCGGFKEPPAKILMGGPMMGLSVVNPDVPVIKQNNAILALTESEIQISDPQPCIRCGRCVNSCPVRLSPVDISEAYEKMDMDELAKLNADVCMGCGVCSYGCPAKRLLTPATTLARMAYLGHLRAQAQKEKEKEAAANGK